ncbi:MAG TPA: hypothetical protein VNN09_01435, partial [Candidatus Competibacteraceae bacterium]|nr:hypothetical protein [Candidatus Competibacteraceae bacterium]
MPEQPSETIFLLANRDLRLGPDSPLLRLMRELEPYFREVLKPRIYALEGTYRALLRHGLLQDYPELHALPAGRQGGLVAMSDMIVAGSGRDGGCQRVIYLVDPRDPTSLLPDSLALKRECVVTETTFLATYAAASEWYRLQWRLTPGSDGQGEHPSVAGYFLPPELSRRLFGRADNGLAARTIALIAHDTRKKHMLQFAVQHFELLRAFAARVATGTTGTLLNGRLPERLARAWEELDEEIAVFQRLGQMPRRLQQALEERQQLEAARQSLQQRLGADAWVQAQPSGPRGGDIQIAEMVRTGACQTVLFFEDPFVSREHEADIQLMERTTRIPGQEALCLHERQSATQWAQNWGRCLALGVDEPMTLSQAFRRLWGVDLVLAGVDGRPEAELWQAIVAKAAWYLHGHIARCAQQRAAEGEPVRVAVTWGREMGEVLEDLREVPVALARLDEQHPGLFRHLADSRFRDPHHLLAVPTVGLIGTTHPRHEANANAERLAALYAGQALRIPHPAFYRQRSHDTPYQPELDELVEHWERLDLAILSCDCLPESWGATALVPGPTGSRLQWAETTVG